MKAFDFTDYYFYLPSIAKHLRPASLPFKVAVISDIHFGPRVPTSRLMALTQFLRQHFPDYIFIPGDIIDSADSVDSYKEQQRLLRWLKSLGRVAPVMLGLGNHDFYRRAPEDYWIETGASWVEDYPQTFFEQVADIPRLHLLNNTSYQDQNLYVYGYTQPPQYFQFSYQAGHPSIFHPDQETKSVMLKDLRRLQPTFKTESPKQSLKFILIHSPIFLHDANIQQLLQPFNFYISGHMHNGIVPPVLNELWLSDRGIISPTRQFSPTHIRRTMRTYQDKSLVVGAVTTIHGHHRLHALNAVFPTFITMLNFTNNQQYQRKPYVKHQYLSWPATFTPPLHTK